MSNRLSIRGYQKIILFFFAGMLPLAASSNTDELIREKRVKVAMRTIGHKVLMCWGDGQSRILPIEKAGEQYKIPFETEFGFDPNDIVSIVYRVMQENRTATDYLVEVEQCETKEVVHSFEIRNAVNPDMIACGGRMVPEDCYSLLITLLDPVRYDDNLMASSTDPTSLNTNTPSERSSSYGPPETNRANPLGSASLIVPFLVLVGLVGYFIKKKNPAGLNPDLILVGNSRFDKRNMVLSFKNKHVELSNKEAELLSLLHNSANSALEREVILQRVWGDEGDYVGRTLDVFVSKLRKKLEADASVKIVNIRGVGYKLVVDALR